MKANNNDGRRGRKVNFVYFHSLELNTSVRQILLLGKCSWLVPGEVTKFFGNFTLYKVSISLNPVTHMSDQYRIYPYNSIQHQADK